MKKLITAALALSLLGSAAQAGGPVVIIDEPEPVVVTTATPTSSGGIWVPILIGAALICAAACGGSDS